ncbi:MAG: Gfo/Idh/MocA family oxidoreductase [Planctomycetes bacterium]|nr:Gfo/Idh/MocA family oxidoreductase [Planctomycetota bacterium]
MADKIKWGVLATGSIAHKFTEALSSLDDVELTAVGSRSLDNARAFADQYGFKSHHGSYEELAQNPDVDVIYVSTPNTFHCENTLLCIAHGKSVLCEKPFAINARQTQQMIDAANKSNVFLMEAMWTRFIPVIAEVRKLIAAGTIGDVRSMQADFGYASRRDLQSRAFNLDLGGGALLDVGIYTISLASMVFGAQPATISSVAHLGPTGADEQSAYLFGYDNDRFAQLSSAVATQTQREVHIHGTKGMIKLNAPFWYCTKADVIIDDQTETIEIPLDCNGFEYQARHVNRCLRDQKLQSDIMPQSETLEIMQTLDRIRADWHLKYPNE